MDLIITNLTNRDYTSLLHCACRARIVRDHFARDVVLTCVDEGKSLSDAQREVLHKSAEDAYRLIRRKVASGVIRKEGSGYIYDRALNRKLWAEAQSKGN